MYVCFIKAVCLSALQCVAVCCSVLQREVRILDVCCSVLYREVRMLDVRASVSVRLRFHVCVCVYVCVFACVCERKLVTPAFTPPANDTREVMQEQHMSRVIITHSIRHLSITNSIKYIYMSCYPHDNPRATDEPYNYRQLHYTFEYHTFKKQKPSTYFDTLSLTEEQYMSHDFVVMEDRARVHAHSCKRTRSLQNGVDS